MKKKIAVIVLSMAILVGLPIAGIVNAKAQGANGNSETIIQKLVARFGLKTEEVKQVFDEARQERQTKMQENYDQRLTKLVDDKKITEAQKQLILNKQKELQAQRAAGGKKNRTDLENWAKDNGIDLSLLRMFGGMGKRGGWKGM